MPRSCQLTMSSVSCANLSTAARDNCRGPPQSRWRTQRLANLSTVYAKGLAGNLHERLLRCSGSGGPSFRFRSASVTYSREQRSGTVNVIRSYSTINSFRTSCPLTGNCNSSRIFYCLISTLRRACASQSQDFCNGPPRSGSTRRFHASSVHEGRYICDTLEDEDGEESCCSGISAVEVRRFDDELADYEEDDSRALADLDKSRAEFEEEIAEEYWVVTFYHFVEVEDPHLEVARHKSFLEGCDVRGRIYISYQGINAQLSSRGKAAIEYAEWVKEDSRFSDLLVQISPSPEGHGFPRLRLRYKPSLVQVTGGTQHLPVTDVSCRAVPLTPREWSERLDDINIVGSTVTASQDLWGTESMHINGATKIDSSNQRRVILLDIRNGYEWDVGHFKGAQRPNVDCFKSTAFGFADQEDGSNDPLANTDKETVDVLMYCTGGIRCDVYSTMLRQKGFKNLYSLKGGVSNYLREEGPGKWIGNLFVFDSRLAVPPTIYKKETSLEKQRDWNNISSTHDSLAKCKVCGGPVVEPRHRNCANLDCNLLYVSCADCISQHKGCCCGECASSPRLRPLLSSHQYDRWHNYRPVEPKPLKPAGYLSHRALKRRRRKERRKLLNSNAPVEDMENHSFSEEVASSGTSWAQA